MVVQVADTLIAKHITRVFTDDNAGQVTALKDFSLEITSPQIVGLIGPSGCGKSSFLRLVAGLDQAQEGTLLYNGENITKPDPHLGLVFQNAALFEWLTVYENIAFGLRARKIYKEQKGRIQPLIDQMGLSGFEHYYPHQLSGGMASRTALARSFIQDPGVVLLDEPLSALDAFTRATIQDQVLEEQRKAQAIVLLVTHDIEEAVYLCDRIAVMSPRPGKDPSLVNWVVYPNPEMELALDRGEIDGFAGYDPFPSIAWENGKTQFYSNTYDEGLKEYLCCFIGLSQRTLESEHGEEIAARLSAAFKKACEYLQENPEDAAKLIQEAGYIAGDADLNAQLISDYTWIAGDKQLLDDSINEIWMQVYRAGALEDAPDDEAGLKEYIAEMRERMVAYYGS